MEDENGGDKLCSKKLYVAFDFGWRSAFQRCAQCIILNPALPPEVALYPN